MSYSPKYDEKVKKFLERIPSNIAKRIVQKIGSVGKTGKGLEPLRNHPFEFKIRIGPYRALVELSHNPNMLWVRFIEHRKRVYKR